MLKNITRLECKIAEKIYHLTCDIDSPLHEVKESLFQFLKYIGQIEDQIEASKTQQQTDDKKEELVQPEVKEG